MVTKWMKQILIDILDNLSYYLVKQIIEFRRCRCKTSQVVKFSIFTFLHFRYMQVILHLFWKFWPPAPPVVCAITSYLQVDHTVFNNLLQNLPSLPREHSVIRRRDIGGIRHLLSFHLHTLWAANLLQIGSADCSKSGSCSLRKIGGILHKMIVQIPPKSAFAHWVFRRTSYLYKKPCSVQTVHVRWKKIIPVSA